MPKYYFELADSGTVSEWICNNDTEAAKAAVDQLASEGYDVEAIVEDDDWSVDGLNDDGEQCYRLLFWASEEDADNDCGAKSIAQISRVGEPSSDHDDDPRSMGWVGCDGRP